MTKYILIGTMGFISGAIIFSPQIFGNWNIVGLFLLAFTGLLCGKFYSDAQKKEQMK